MEICHKINFKSGASLARLQVCEIDVSLKDKFADGIGFKLFPYRQDQKPLVEWESAKKLDEFVLSFYADKLEERLNQRVAETNVRTCSREDVDSVVAYYETTPSIGETPSPLRKLLGSTPRIKDVARVFEVCAGAGLVDLGRDEENPRVDDLEYFLEIVAAKRRFKLVEEAPLSRENVDAALELAKTISAERLERLLTTYRETVE